MKIVARRRTATLALASLTAVVAAVAVAPAASAADITAISPIVVSNTQSRSLTIEVDGATTGTTGTLTLARSDAPTETISKGVVRSDVSTYTTGSTNPLVLPNINFATALGGQPANPGQYDATLTTDDRDPAAPDETLVFTCQRCFTIDAPSLSTTVANIVPSGVPAGATQTVTINGTGFAAGTTVVALPNSGDSFTAGTDPSRLITFSHVNATTTQLRKAVRVGDKVAPGKRTLRLTNTNGNQFDCIDCFTVTGPELTGVFPVSAANDGVKTIRFTAASGVTLADGSTMRLEYLFGGMRNAALDIVGTGPTLNATKTEITGQFDLLGAAPNAEAYQPVVVRPDGSASSCTCRFSVLQGPAPAPTAVSPATVPANSTQVLTVTGTGFARGATVRTAVNTPPSINAERIVVTKVEHVSPTRLLVTVNIPANAQMGTRDLTVTNTDGQSGTCEECFEVAGTAVSPTPTSTSTASPRPSTSASATPSGSPSASPSGTVSPTASATTSPRPSTSTTAAPACSVTPTVRLDRSTITATGSAGITVTGTADSVVDVFAYSRPSTTYRLVRSGDVGGDGVSTYTVTPPTNTRLYAQQRGCDAGPSVVLNVRTQLSLNVVRNGTRNYTFSGSAIPARPNGLIVSLYRVEADGRQILTAQTRANANVGQPGYDSTRRAGSYTIRRQFTGSGRFGFVVRTGQDLQNAPGTSNVRSLAVF